MCVRDRVTREIRNRLLPLTTCCWQPSRKLATLPVTVSDTLAGLLSDFHMRDKTHRWIEFWFLLNQPKPDCIYYFPVDFESNWILFGYLGNQNGSDTLWGILSDLAWDMKFCALCIVYQVMILCLKLWYFVSSSVSSDDTLCQVLYQVMILFVSSHVSSDDTLYQVMILCIKWWYFVSSSLSSNGTLYQVMILCIK